MDITNQTQTVLVSQVKPAASPANQVASWHSLLRALAQIESGDNPKTVGKSGETGKYQIMPKVRKAYVDKLKSKNITGVGDDLLVVEILSDMTKMYRDFYDREPDTNTVYCLWNSPHRTMNNKISKTMRERATRFSNLVELYENEQKP
jgi:hypothetical protein